MFLLGALSYARIPDLWRRGYPSGFKASLITWEFLCGKVLLKYNRDRESF